MFEKTNPLELIMPLARALGLMDCSFIGTRFVTDMPLEALEPFANIASDWKHRVECPSKIGSYFGEGEGLGIMDAGEYRVVVQYRLESAKGFASEEWFSNFRKASWVEGIVRARLARLHVDVLSVKAEIKQGKAKYTFGTSEGDVTVMAWENFSENYG